MYPPWLFVVGAVIVVLHVKHHFASGSTLLFGLVASSISVALTPLISLVLMGFFVFKYSVSQILKNEPGYMGLMEGGDAYWAVEKDYAKSVINALFMMDLSKKCVEGKQPIEMVREVVQEMLNKNVTSKLTCKKKMSKYGYIYFKKCDINLKENVRIIEQDLQKKSDLERFMSEVANEPLIKDSFWEVLVGKNPVEGLHPVIFRVHHVLGDGPGLIQFFLEFMDSSTYKTQQKVVNKNIFQRLINFEWYNSWGRITTSVLNIIDVYVCGLIVLIQEWLASVDHNSLHNRLYLSGKKVCCWSSIDLQIVKDIRRAKNCRFTDVLLKALSDSMESCFKKWGEDIETVNVVHPARLSDTEVRMSNLFTVAVVQMPIKGYKKLSDIQSITGRLKKLPHLYVNYWIITVAFSVIPASIWSRFVKSSQCTILLSNIPGPSRLATFVGCMVNEMVFILPNRDTTGVGISMLSYVDKLSIGLIVDDSLITKTEQAVDIIEGATNSIKQMHSSLGLKS